MAFILPAMVRVAYPLRCPLRATEGVAVRSFRPGAVLPLHHQQALASAEHMGIYEHLLAQAWG